MSVGGRCGKSRKAGCILAGSFNVHSPTNGILDATFAIWKLLGGFAAGAVVGSALASSYYYPLVWNGYAWVRACI